MDSGRERLRLRLGAGAAAALALFISGGSVWLKRPESRAAAVDERIINRSEEVCRKLTGTGMNLQFTTERAIHGGKAGISWMVDCTDDQGTDQAHMIWDSGADMLRSVSRHAPLNPRKLARPITQKEALIVAGQWLRALPLAAGGERWRLVGAARSLTAWHLSCRTRRSRAHLVIDAGTAELVSAVGALRRKAL